MAAGTYFYTVDVVFDVLDNTNATKQLKGWLELVN